MLIHKYMSMAEQVMYSVVESISGIKHWFGEWPNNANKYCKDSVNLREKIAAIHQCIIPPMISTIWY